MFKAHKLPVLQNILLVLCMQWGIIIKFLTIWTKTKTATNALSLSTYI